MFKNRFDIESLKRIFEKNGLWYLILVIIFIALVLYVYPQECKDEDCFSKALSSCDRARFVNVEQGNTVEYNIGWGFRTCKLNVEIKEVNKGTTSKLVKALEGKSMKCRIPKNELKLTTFKSFEDIIDYCSGSLKEGLYTVMIERMYVLITRELGNITVKLEEALIVV